MIELMTRHPRSVGETYGEHMATAFSFAAALMLASLACLVHGLLPFLCQSTASRRVRALSERMSRRAAAGTSPSAAAPTGIADARA